MKKTSIVLFLILSLVICLLACQDDSDDVKDTGQDFEGKALESSLPYDGEQIFYRENGSIEKIIKYENGETLWIREYDKNGDYIRYTEYTVYGYFVEDKAHGSVTERITYYDTDGKVNEAIAYEYHENGMILKEILYSGIGEIKGIYEYDESGVTVKTHIYEKNGENYLLSETVEFTYNSDGKPLKDIYYRSDGSLLSVSQYNENGDTLKNTRYDENGELASYTVYEYGENGVKLREIYYTSLESISSVCEYREDGTKLKLTNYFENGNVSLVYEYGETGNVQRIEKYKSDGYPASIEEFDENGVRIKYTTFNDDKTTLIYDGNYNIIEGIRYLRQANGAFIKYEYFDGIIRRETVRDSGIGVSYIISYDADGRKTSDIRYDADGSFELRTLYRYNEVGELLSYTVYDKSNSILTYGADGNIISGIRYVYSKGQLYQKTEYEGGLKTKETFYSNGSIVLISEYDESESLRKESFYSSGKLSRVREYDANGVLRKDTLYNKNGKVVSVTRYDEKGNKT